MFKIFPVVCPPCPPSPPHTLASIAAPPNSSLLIGAGDGGDKPPSTEAAGHSPGPSASPHARPSSRGAGKASYRAPTMLETTLRNASASTQSFPMLAKR